ncbi:uncharacterized protein LOC119166789 isoform X2 [Rhipicephalus microplus]|uniref:uncharacterized protein LOC119166789 isoform X2 n=1 Tax=Rhipicephalus microplus TaxID=6941 RepID=UPI003F6BF317
MARVGKVTPVGGLCGCANLQTANPFILIMQVFARIITDLLVSAFLTASSATPGNFGPAGNGSEPCVSLLPVTRAAGPSAAPPIPLWIIERNLAALSPSTTSYAQTIKQQPPSTAPCGLRSCANSQTANPFILIMQQWTGMAFPVTLQPSRVHQRLRKT